MRPAAQRHSSLVWIRRVQKRLADNLEGQTTDRLIPAVQHGTAGDRYFRRDRDQVAVSAPTLILPSCLLPRGHVVADHPPSNHLPVLVHRDPSNGQVRAYVNQCRHRGAALVTPQSCDVSAGFSSRPLKGSALTCPYHAWTYDVRTGDLKAVPGEADGFPCLDKSTLGLRRLPCVEVAGGIWVGDGGRQMGGDGEEETTHQGGREDLWAKTDIHNELSDLWLPPILPAASEACNAPETSTRLVGFREWQLEANWQLIVETFLETYHVQYLHKDTLGLVTHNNNMVVDRSVRHTVPLTNFDIGSLDPDETSAGPKDPFFAQTTTTYFLFPNASISLLKRFALFMSIVPEVDERDRGGGSTRSRVRAWGVTHAGAEGEDLTLQQRDFESVVNGIEEDWECTEHIQRGLKKDTVFHHGRFEGINVEFLRNVEEVAKILDKIPLFTISPRSASGGSRRRI